MAGIKGVFIEKNNSTDIVVNVSEFKGNTNLSIRECWLDARTPGVRNPTKKGITISVEKAEELVKAIRKAVKEAKSS